MKKPQIEIQARYDRNSMFLQTHALLIDGKPVAAKIVSFDLQEGGPCRVELEFDEVQYVQIMVVTRRKKASRRRKAKRG